MSNSFSVAATAVAFVVLGSAAAFAGYPAIIIAPLPPEFVFSPIPVSVPEPATIALLASGIAGVVATKRFRRRQ